MVIPISEPYRAGAAQVPVVTVERAPVDGGIVVDHSQIVQRCRDDATAIFMVGRIKIPVTRRRINPTICPNDRSPPPPNSPTAAEQVANHRTRGIGYLHGRDARG